MTEEAKGLAMPQLSASLARLVEGVSKSVVEIGSGRRALASGFDPASRACGDRR